MLGKKVRELEKNRNKHLAKYKNLSDKLYDIILKNMGSKPNQKKQEDLSNVGGKDIYLDVLDENNKVIFNWRNLLWRNMYYILMK